MADDFAQSREPDDLFSDEIEPAEYQPLEQAHTIAAPQESVAAQEIPPNKAPGPRVGRRGGRGGPGNNGGRSGTPSRARSQQPEIPTPSDADAQENSPAPVSAAPAPDADTRITAVRGDRSATGPAKPQKKSAAELEELMAAMQLKNAVKAEAYARAEKDQASFLHREQQAAFKRIEERKAIKEQNLEREKNRERKIKAKGGREWDLEKQDSDIVDRTRGPSSMYLRGAHGGIAAPRGGGGLASSRFSTDEPEEFSPRGRDGGRGRFNDFGPQRGGRGGRGGRGRGGNLNGSVNAQISAGDQDFPALPSPAVKVKEATTDGGNPAPELLAKVPADEKGPPSGIANSDWAEEMAASTEKA